MFASFVPFGDVSGDLQRTDIIVFDTHKNAFDPVGVNYLNVLSPFGSISGSISGDGSEIAIATTDQLDPRDVDENSDIYIINRQTGYATFVSLQLETSEFGHRAPVLSRDGGYLVFASESNAVPYPQLLGYSTSTGELKVLSVSNNGNPGNFYSALTSPSPMSADGRFVVFESGASNFSSDDGNIFDSDIFLLDTSTGAIHLLSRSINGKSGAGNSYRPSISADGRIITFISEANDLVPFDGDPGPDAFIVSNPLLSATIPVNLQAGESFADVIFNAQTQVGSISGRLFFDSVINRVYDLGEDVISNSLVYLDRNRNGILDRGEPQTFTDSEGRYWFDEVPTFRNQTIVVAAPSGFEQIAPERQNQAGFTFFLPAGGNLNGIDFAFRPIQATGQSSRSEVSGRLFVDKNVSGTFDDGDQPLVGVEVFLDAANFGVRDDNEPRTLTDDQGRYSFDGLSARNVAVTTVLSNEFVHVNPLGSKFDRVAYPLNRGVSAFGNPQAIASGDFNGNGFLDVAIALGDANKLSIRLNDGQGGFLPDEIDIDLGTNGARPTSLVVGQFDNDADQRLDVALTANSTGYVTVLLNFDPVSKQFASINHVKVGEEPLDIAAGSFNGNGRVDLVVVNKANNTVQVLSNNGSGVFTAGPGVPTGGRNASSIVVGNFTGDASLDVAVIHANPRTGASNPFGEMTVLRGNGSGGLTRQPEFYTLGATPTDAVVADFNGDDLPDIAVSNFGTNSISILLGKTDGTFRVQTTTLGTASGVIDITVGDVDNDGDIDIFVSNLRDRNISIFRNDGPDPDNPDPLTREVRFQPLENIGLGQFSLAQRMPIIVDNFDKDPSSPGGKGTVDIVTILRATDGTTQLNVLTNTLVNGAHRVALTGLNTVNNRDFIIKPAILPPSFAAIVNPLPILEDAGAQSITITNIVKGRTTGPDLRFIVTSDNPTVIPSPGLIAFSGGTTTTFSYTSLPNTNDKTNAIDPQQSRPTVLTVQAIDAGADGVFDTDDDGIFDRSFTVSVLPVNDPPVFNLLPEVTRTQKAGMQTVAGVVTGLGVGGGSDEEDQVTSAQVTSAFDVMTDNSFFITPPAIDANGQLTFNPSPNKSGAVPVTVSVSDNGGRANGGVDTTTKTFVINILPVNDPPTINLIGNQSVRADAGLRTVPNFANGFLPGGGEDEASQVISDFIVTVDSPGLFSVLPSIAVNGTLTYAPAINRTGTATVSVQVRDSGGRANNGNDLSAVQTFTITVNPIPDTTRPTPVIRPTAAALTNQASFEVEVDFGEPVTGFTLADIVVSSGTKSARQDLTGGRFKFLYTGSDGSVTFNIAENITSDLAGNPNFAAVPVTRTIDTIGVTARVDSPVANPTNAASFTATIEFGEPVLGFTPSDLTVLNGSATNLVPVNAATGSYSVTITPANDGTVTVLLPAGVVTDAAGNGNIAADPLIRTVDRARPTVTLSSNEPAITNRTSFDLFAQFNEPVTTLTAAGLNITGGTAGTPVLVSPGLYRIPITATVGEVRVRVVEAAVNDLAGNPSQASSEFALTVDPAVVFTPSLNSTSATMLNTTTFVATVNFGAQVSGFTVDKIVVVNGAASGLTPVNAANGHYTFTVTAGLDGQVSVVIPADVANDAAGIPNAASNVLIRTIDRVAPQPRLSVNVPSLTNQANFVLTVEFGEEVNGFELNDVVASGATLSALQHLGGGRYTMNVTATHGPVSFNLPAGAANDLAGNPNMAATPVTLTVDTSSPLATLTTATPNLSNADSFTVAANFGERVLGFELGDLLLSNGVASDLVEVNQATGGFTFVVTPDGDGLVTVLVPAGSAADQAGNLSRVSSLLSRSFDRTAPVPVLSTTEPSRTNRTTFEVIVNFGETVDGLTKSDFQVTGATIGDPQPLGGGRYAVNITATADVVEVSLPAGAVVDNAGNTNSASNILSRTIETTRVLPLLNASVSPVSNASSYVVSIDFTKQVVGFDQSSLFAVGAALSDFTVVDQATGRYSVRVTPMADGVVTLLLPANAATDLVGNGNLAAAPLVRTIDRVAPVVTLSTSQSSPTVERTFAVIVQGSEAITGLTASSFQVSGGSIDEPL
ncbi:MAG TPA: hypothetical protein DDZ51_12770, partial [Planctomycetaceae bacterium]|nr:hypothetical protein [Planctomycetaceae bacterium]